MSIFFYFVKSIFLNAPVGKSLYAAGDASPLRSVSDARHILVVSASMQHTVFSHSAFKKTLTVIKNNSRDLYALYFPLPPPEMEIYTIYVHCKLLKRR